MNKPEVIALLVCASSAAQRLSSVLLDAVVNAPLDYYDERLVGEITNRWNKLNAEVDEALGALGELGNQPPCKGETK